MSTPEEVKGPSKGELKKLAKKAEKAASKDGIAPPPAAPAPPAPVSSTPATRVAPKLLLINASTESMASIKAMWASQQFSVPLSSGNNNNNKTSLITETALVLGDQITLGSGGNSMVQAIRWMSPSYNHNTIIEDTMVDEWCEWERTILRKSNNNNNNKGLDDLNAKLLLSGGGGRHYLVGHATTVADICVATTLSVLLAVNTTTTTTLPPAVAAYLAFHMPSISAAKEHLVNFVGGGGTPAVLNLDEPSLDKILTDVFTVVLKDLYGTDVALPTNNWIAKCTNAKHGDYQCTAAMSLFATLKNNSNIGNIHSPHDIANAICASLEHNPVVTDAIVNGPGFVLCRIRASYLQRHVNTYLSTSSTTKSMIQTSTAVTPMTCVVDFSSPNIAKEMHVGHLRSTIIGESVCRILEAVGHVVHRVNHVGDWGTQFGMLIQYLKEEYPNFGDDMPNITDLTVFYKAAKERFDTDADFKKISQTNVVLLQSGDEECLKVWKVLCDVSRREFQKVYDRLGVTVHECGESFYNDKIPAVIEEFEKAGMIQLEEGGAKCVFLEGAQIPLMLQKSDGGFGYDSTDMAALKYRLHTLNASRIICITDFSQGDHFKMCNQAARQIGWVQNNQSLEHIGFGTVQGEDGKRFKTRSGDTVRLVDLLDEAVQRMETTLRERIAENKSSITEDEVHSVAEAMGYSAVRYFDLRRNPTTNYKFSYDQMLDTKGNTAIYLLYAQARLTSIMAKAKEEHKVDVDELLANNNTPVIIAHPSERNLALQLQQFTDTMALTLQDLYPYHICDYVYNLATTASDFCTQCKVLGSPEMNSRLLLCKATTMAMRECFDLLGIANVQRI